MNINDIIMRLDRKMNAYQSKLNELLPDDRYVTRLDNAENLIREVMGHEIFQALLVRVSCQELQHLINTVEDWRAREATKLKGNKHHGREKGGI